MSLPRGAGLAMAVAVAAFHAATLVALTVDVADRRVTVLSMDDTYITLRHARQLARGQGFRWSDGEPPVEGFSSPAWLLLATLLMRVSADPAPLMVAAAGLCHAGSVAVVHHLLRARLGCGGLSAAAGAGAIALWQPMAWQVQAGGEMNLLGLCLLSAADLLLSARQRTRLAGALVGGSLMAVRPDAGLLVAALAAGSLLRVRDGRGPLLAAFLAVPLFISTWRALAFGTLVPNTYLLKVPHRPGRVLTGARYVRRFLQWFHGAPLLLVATAVPRRDPLLAALAAAIPATLLAVAYLGGDAWDQWRLLVPVMPLLVIVLGAVSAGARRRWIPAVIWIGLLASLSPPLLRGLGAGRVLPVPRQATLENVRVGLVLGAACRPGALTAHFHAGAAPYYAELPSLDLLGRCDAAVARRPAEWREGIPGHDKLDVAGTLARRPDVVVSHHRVPFPRDERERLRPPPNGFALRLTEDPRFLEAYEPVDCELSRRWHGIYRRRGSEGLDVVQLLAAEARILAPTAP